MEKNREIQILRGIAISSVVMIHILNLALTNIPRWDIGYSLYSIVHSLLQYAVPCFIFISSLVYAYVYRNRQFKFKRYFKSKMFVIVVPYIIWTLIYLLLQMAAGYIPFYKLSKPTAWLYWLGYGKAYTHLYFMSVIIQFYIAVPLMFWFVSLFNKYIVRFRVPFLLVLMVLPQIVIYWINRLYIYNYFKSTATLFPWYWCLSIVGLSVGLNYESSIGFIKSNIKVLLSVFSISLIIYITYQYRLMVGLSVNTFYYQMQWYVYVVLVSLLLLVLSKKLLKIVRIAEWLEYIAKHSFEIYFIHPLLTLILCKTIKTSNSFLLLLIMLISYYILMRICCLVSETLRNYKLTYFIVGKYEPMRNNKYNN